MRRIAQQRHPAERPVAHRIAVAHRVLVKRLRCPDQRHRVEHVEVEGVFHERQQFCELALPVPVLAPRHRRVCVAQFCRHRPVHQHLAVVALVIGNGVEHELGGHAAGNHHRLARLEWLPERGATPQHDAVPLGRALVRIELLAHSRMNAVCCNHAIAADPLGLSRAADLEHRSSAPGIAVHAGAGMAGLDGVWPQPCDHRILEHAL